MATTPGPRRRETRTDITGQDRDTLYPMQEPLGSMDRPGIRTSEINEMNLPPDKTVRRTGNLGVTGAERGGRGFTATFAIAAVVLIAAFLIALYIGNSYRDVATTNGTQSPIADTTNNGTTNDTTGSTTTPSQQTAPGTGDAGNTTGTTTPPANP